ncbi:MAG: ribonuclease PH [Spirochaetes bacterium GWF1_31_7]|nr:MAG: ribonuclease PH [Spirochaetes bacterium GWE1_32_154]OHD51597.1 MAG: ribonuclease PH [Spirochaetes bacterium GWE2_31_10]OHD52969.1 MAG: ribonuclease PH [Spirochaetes bacterium GWF1_31_7]OHD82219.1 MAG: ribonuclease PH [Spirochaetes bacterium RIFOXYB1_FULL_32_8]HBD93714.1 ribonuclease PH [Spirochaetia bacterium]
MYTRTNRLNKDTRLITFNKDPMPNAYSSVEVKFGRTVVYCTVSLSSDVPEFASKVNKGWLSAEYSMLPASTGSRKKRDGIKQDGRGVEISRLIGRSLRASVDLYKMNGYSIIIDCDVIVADGGTRTAAISGGFCALKLAVNRMIKEGLISENPILFSLASISAGKVSSEIMVDLDYIEDSSAEVDFNIVMNDRSEYIEIQGSAEKGIMKRDEFNALLDYSENALKTIFKFQNDFFASV